MRRESGVDEAEIEEVGIAQGQIVNTQWLSFKRRDLRRRYATISSGNMNDVDFTILMLLAKVVVLDIDMF
jgi:hypothetical protein